MVSAHSSKTLTKDTCVCTRVCAHEGRPEGTSAVISQEPSSLFERQNVLLAPRAHQLGEAGEDFLHLCLPVLDYTAMSAYYIDK